MTEYTEVPKISKAAPAEISSERLTFPEIMGGSSKANLPDETILRAASIPYMMSKRDAYPYPSVQISDNVFSNINNLPLKFSESDLRQEKLRGDKLQNERLQPEIPRPEVQRTEIQRQETRRAEMQQTGDRVLPSVTRGIETPSKAFEYNNLKNRSGDHRSPDAILYVSKNFDPTKPVNLVIYNHGFGSTVKSAFKDNELGKQMADSPPNTVLIVPEWQSSPGSRGYSQGNLAKPGAFRAMVEEVFDKTPELRGKTMRDVSKIHILSHSAGHAPTESQLYNNGISNKVASVTMIDSNYSPQKMEPWIKSNIREFAEMSRHEIKAINLQLFKIIFAGNL